MNRFLIIGELDPGIPALMSPAQFRVIEALFHGTDDMVSARQDIFRIEAVGGRIQCDRRKAIRTDREVFQPLSFVNGCSQASSFLRATSQQACVRVPSRHPA